MQFESIVTLQAMRRGRWEIKIKRETETIVTKETTARINLDTTGHKRYRKGRER